MSDTPRTDAAKWMKIGCVSGVDINFAETLERQLMEARSCLVEAMSFCEATDGTKGAMFGCSVTGYKMARWRKAAGIDTANAGGEGRGASPRTSPPPCSPSGDRP